MKKFITFFAAVALLAGFTPKVLAQDVYGDFSAVAPSGQTLYYVIRGSSTVAVCAPGFEAGKYSCGRGGYWLSYVQKPVGDLIIPNTVTYNGITYSVTEIATGAFNDCNELTNIVIPNTVTAIRNSAFQSCVGLTSITIPASVVYIEHQGGSCRQPFTNCSNLTSIVVEDGNTVFDCRNNCNAIIETATNTLILGCMNTTIPNSVTSIGSDAFYGCRGLCSLTIPNSVSEIGMDAFGGWPCGIPNIIYEGNATGSPWGAVTHNGFMDGFLVYKDASRTYLSSCCKSAEGAVTIPSTVDTIDQYAFRWCTGLSTIVVESGNAVYDSRSNCNAIIETTTNTLLFGFKTTTIPNSVTSIGDFAFEECSGLTAVTIPNTVTSIGYRAFDGCTGLTSVNIGNSVTSIGQYAFRGCTEISEIFCKCNVPPTLGSSYDGYYNTYYPFDDIPTGIPVYIPCGRTPYYTAAEGWSRFTNFIEEGENIFSAVSADNQMGVVQILTRPTCTNPQAVIYASPNSGYRFDHWSDGNTANPYSLTVTEDTELIGYFVPDGGSNGIDDAETADNIKVYTRGNTIVIDFSGQQAAVSKQDIVVYDVMGRVIKQSADSGQQAAIEIPVTSAGVYMVKVGDRPSRKVLVRP